MINLLPVEHKGEIRAARANVILVRYIVIMLAAIIVLSGLVIGSYLVLNTAQANAEVKVKENEQRVSSFKNVRAQAEVFRSDLAVAKTVLDSDVSFSKLIYKIASSVPSGVILSDLTLDPQNFGSSITMNASAKTFDDATKLKDAFSRSEDIFSNVQLQNIRSSTEAGGSDTNGYPVSVTLSVVINKGALQ
jgi:Tfp pilus assembly protein PilN